MLPDELARQIEAIILAADAEFARSMTRVQNTLYESLLAIVKGLEVDEEGYILQNTANRRLLSEAEAKISEIFSTSLYQNAVSKYVFTIPKVDELNQRYFTTIPRFKENKQFLKSLQSQTIKTIEKYILQDGLESQVISPLSQIMNQNVNSGGKFSGFLQQIQDYIKGNDKVEGRALSYSRTFLRDSMFTYARTYQQSVTNDLQLEFYLYSGGVMDKTRPFCEERTGKFYHHREIEKWAALEWAGKKAGTTESSIFLFAGGWNCAHQIIPVDRNIVPDEVIERSMQLGFIS
jgi:hypothetical protein